MEALDFSRFKDKYPLLKSTDISFLNKFFNKKDIFLFFEEQEEKRKK